MATTYNGKTRAELIPLINEQISKADPAAYQQDIDFYNQRIPLATRNKNPDAARKWATEQQTVRALESLGYSGKELSHINQDINTDPNTGAASEAGWWERHKTLGPVLAVLGAAGGAAAAPAIAGAFAPATGATAAGGSTAAASGGAIAGGVEAAPVVGGMIPGAVATPLASTAAGSAAAGAAPIAGTSLSTGSSALGSTGGLGAGGSLATAPTTMSAGGGGGLFNTLMSKYGKGNNTEAISKGLSSAAQGMASNRGTKAGLMLDQNAALEEQLLKREADKRAAQNNAYQNVVRADMAQTWKPAARPNNIPTISYGGGLSPEGLDAARIFANQNRQRLGSADLQNQSGMPSYNDLSKNKDFQNTMKSGAGEKLAGIGSIALPLISKYFGK